MLPKRPERADTGTLIWEYIDGQTSPTRLAQLEERLRTRKQDRERFVDSATLHAMLTEVFRQNVALRQDISAGGDETIQAELERPRPRRKQSAA